MLGDAVAPFIVSEDVPAMIAAKKCNVKCRCSHRISHRDSSDSSAMSTIHVILRTSYQLVARRLPKITGSVSSVS